MGYIFAHMADLHLGAHSEPVIRQMEQDTLNYAIDACLERKIAFLVLAGDIYDSNLPNLDAVNNTVKQFMRLRKLGIPIYYVYGSHDNSVGETSIINILESANVFTRVAKYEEVEGKIRLLFITDPKTGAKIVGLPGRASNMEKYLYERLDLHSLEQEDGFKIFLFHAMIDEVKPGNLAKMDSLSISLFPQRFSYYAGGHLHKKVELYYPNYGEIRYPGPIFAGRPQDFEDSANHEPRGFYFVSVNDEKGPNIEKIEYFSTQRYEFNYLVYNAENKISQTVFTDLIKLVKEKTEKDHIVVLKIFGILAGGKTSDINFTELRKLALNNGARFITINRYGLRTKDIAIVTAPGEKKEEIEENLFKEHIDQIKVTNPVLKGKLGISLAVRLLNVFRQPSADEENQKDYTERIQEDGIRQLQVEDIFQ